MPCPGFVAYNVTSMIPCMCMDLAINAIHFEQTPRVQFYKRPRAKCKKIPQQTNKTCSFAWQKMDKLTNYCKKTTMVNRTTTDMNERPGVVATLITVENRRENINWPWKILWNSKFFFLFIRYKQRKSMFAYHILTSITFTCFEWFQWSAIKPKPYQLISQSQTVKKPKPKPKPRLLPDFIRNSNENRSIILLRPICKHDKACQKILRCERFFNSSLVV